MRRFRRLTALLTCIWMIHLVLVGSGFTCVMPAMDAMHGMTMGDVAQSAPGSERATMQDALDPTEPSAPTERPCDLPWAPDGCQSMVPCAPAALAAAPDVVPTPRAVHAGVTGSVVLAPPSLLIPPELPPPRA